MVTEYGDFLDSYDDADSRAVAQHFLMDALGESLGT